MSDRSQQPQIPLVPLNAATLRANDAFISFAPGAAGITLYLIDQREAPVLKIGDPARMANFEVGRFELTPRALRMLLDSAEKVSALTLDSSKERWGLIPAAAGA